MYTYLPRLSLIATLVLACARSPAAEQAPTPAAAAASAFEPVGSYTFVADVEGQARSGTIDIRPNERGVLTGTVYSDEGSIPINTVAVEGNTMRLGFVLPDGTSVGFQLLFSGDAYTGSWSAQGFSGPLRGERRRGG